MKLLFFFVLLLPYFAYSQEALTFTDIVEVPAVNKDELFVRAREWFNENFKSSKDVLQIIDKETGELSGKGAMKVKYELKYFVVNKLYSDITFSMSIWVKDAKYKYEITNFMASTAPPNQNLDFGLITTSDEFDKKIRPLSKDNLNNSYLNIKQNIILKSKLLIDDLKLKMSQNSKTNNW